jgi:hypothetical protein
MRPESETAAANVDEEGLEVEEQVSGELVITAVLDYKKIRQLKNLRQAQKGKRYLLQAITSSLPERDLA